MKEKTVIIEIDERGALVHELVRPGGAHVAGEAEQARSKADHEEHQGEDHPRARAHAGRVSRWERRRAVD